MGELRRDGLDDLTPPCPPAPQGLRPRGLAMPLGWTQAAGSRGLPPRRMVRLPLTTLLADVGTQCGGPSARHAGGRPAPQGKKGGGQRLVFGARHPKAKARHHPHGVERQQKMAPFLPAQAVAPAASDQPGAPPSSSPLGIAGRHPGASAGFREAALGGQEVHERPHASHQRIVVLPHLAMELLPGGPRRQGRPPGTSGIAIAATLPATARPWAAQGPGHHRAATEGCLRPRVALPRQGGLAKSIDPNVKQREAGVGIDQRAAPYLGEDRAMLQVGGTFRSARSGQLTPSV